MTGKRKSYSGAEKGKIALEAVKGALIKNELTSKYKELKTNSKGT